MSTYKPYSELTINERINFRSGWDIPVACESGTCNRFSKSIRSIVPIECCKQVYDIDRFFMSLRTRGTIIPMV